MPQMEPRDSKAEETPSSTPIGITSGTTESDTKPTQQQLWNTNFDKAAGGILGLLSDNEPEAAPDSGAPADEVEEPTGDSVSEDTHEVEREAAGESEEDGAASPTTRTWSLEEDETREAWNAFRRGMWPKESIADYFDRDLKGALDTAKKLAEYQAENARVFQQAKSKEADGKSEAEGAKEAPQPAVDLDALARPVAEELGLDSEGAKKLVQFADQVAEHHTKAVVERAETLARDQGVLGSMLGDLVSELTRRALLGEIPQFADEAVFEKVREKAIALANAGDPVEGKGLTRIENLYREAARLAIKDLPSPKEIQRQRQAASARRNGAPNRPTARQQKPAITDQEHIAQVIQAQDEGLTRDEIVRQFGQRGLRRK